MKRIMCYGDSNTWGYDPEEDDGQGNCGRFPEHVRWTSVMEDLLGPEYRVLEEGLNGRTTVFEDPAAYGRNGYPYLEVAIRTCDPVDCIVFMLGTNDLKDFFGASAHVITNGMARLLRTCRSVLPQTRSAHAKILLAAPLNVTANGRGEYCYDFSALSTEKGEALRAAYRELAVQMDCGFLDVNDYVQASPADGVHLTPESHRKLGEVMAAHVRQLLAE